MNGSDTGYYMIRAMAQTENDFDIFFKNNVVAVGWSRVNFSKCENADILVDKVKRAYYVDFDYAPQFIGRKLHEAKRFYNIVAKSKIIVPHYNHVCLAFVGKECIFNNNYANDEIDLANQRKVEYIKNESNELIRIPRSQLSTQLQQRLRVRGSTILDLYEFSEEIEDLFSLKKEYKWKYRVEKEQDKCIKMFKESLLQKLEKGDVNLEAGGFGMELLIKELLEIEGYRAKVLPKSSFPEYADADILATKVDWSGEELKLLIQVKHHRGITDSWGAKQLEKIKELMPAQYIDYKLILITTGKPSTQLEESCEKYNITLISGQVLIDWLFNSIQKLNNSTIKKLGIVNVPQLI